MTAMYPAADQQIDQQEYCRYSQWSNEDIHTENAVVETTGMNRE